MRKTLRKRADDETRLVTLADSVVPVRIRRNNKARRIILRVDSDTGGALVTLPRRATVAEATALVADQADWLLQCLADLPPRIRFADGAVFPYMGEDHVIYHDPHIPGVVHIDDGRMAISGAPEHLPRRLTDWLKGRARAKITNRAHDMAAKIGKKINRIGIRDTKSRWGSCSPTGNLNFCWRLIMAPPWVMDYVSAHEVAHLRYLDHSKKFWRTVDDLGVQIKPARQWLIDNGLRLQRIG